MEKILFVDDDETMRNAVALILQNFNITIASNKDQAAEILKKEEISLLLADLYMPEAESGFELVKEARELDEDLYIVVITGFGTIESAVKAVKLGADDFITKELSPDEMRMRIKKYLEAKGEKVRLKKLEAENILLKQEIYQTSQLLGKSQAMLEVQKKIDAAAWDNESTVLIEGSSGTGKELAAREIHKRSERTDFSFVAIDCPSLPKELFESELFGHEKGSFTDAKSRKNGRIELAHQGTLFLDEIADLPLSLQAKLLRFLESSEFYRLGGTKPVKVNTRIISATNKDLQEKIKKGEFREDLFFRLQVVVLRMPDLKDRKEDIRLLAYHFLKELNQRKGTNLKLTQGHIKQLLSYDWPGNARELKNTMASFSVLKELPVLHKEKIIMDKPYKEARKESIEAFEREYFRKVLVKNQRNITQTAKEIGISREELSRKLKKLKI